MLPVHLEKLILCKDAVFHTVAVGRSGVCVIPVKENSTIVITNFTYFFFCDFEDPQDVSENLDRSVHQMNISSPKSQSIFIIKNDMSIQGLGVFEVTICSGHYQEDNLYLVHEKDVTVEIIVAPSVVGTVTTPGVPPNDLKTPDPPLSYGTDPATAIPSTISEVYGGAVGEYQPLTRRYSPPSAVTPFLVGGLRYPVNAATALNPTFNNSGSGQRTYPIVNIGYVEIKRALGAELFSSG